MKVISICTWLIMVSLVGCNLVNDENDNFLSHLDTKQNTSLSCSASEQTLVGAGTESSPYLVCSKNHLAQLANSNKYFKLSSDINLSGESFSPIQGFTGTLDGNNKTISHLVISGVNLENVGLFTTLYGATIKDIKLDNFDIENTVIVTGALAGVSEDSNFTNIKITNLELSGAGHVGAIAGKATNVLAKNIEVQATITTSAAGAGGAFGTVSSVNQIESIVTSGQIIATSGNRIGGVIGTLAAGTVSKLASSMAVTTVSSRSGGIIGNNAGTIKWSRFNGSASGTGDFGGIVGNNEAVGKISECYTEIASASIITGSAGGVVGSNYGLVENSYAKIYHLEAVNTGGIARAIYKTSGYDPGTITNSYAVIETQIGTTNNGGISQVGHSGVFVNNCFWDTTTSAVTVSSKGGTGKTTSEMQDESTYTSAGWDFSTIWKSPTGGGYPTLRAFE